MGVGEKRVVAVIAKCRMARYASVRREKEEFVN